MEVDRRSRKRHTSGSEASSDGAPRKKRAKISRLASQSPSLESGGKSSPRGAGKVAAQPPEQEEQLKATGEPSNPVKFKKPHTKRAAVFRPKAGSWLTHIASSVINTLVQQAVRIGIDPRDHLEHLDWSAWAPKVLSAEDLHNLWFFINKEYPTSVSLSDIQSILQPYAKVTPEQLLKEECRAKYKDQIPKAPVSPYFMFTQSKQAKLGAKHPELDVKEAAVVLGRKWRSIGPERQEKYKQRYKLLKERYLENLESFYLEHPDARPVPVITKKKHSEPKKNSKVTDPYNELKKAFPKRPRSAYLVFCKAKRERYHKRHPELSPTEVTVKLGKKWKEMEEEHKFKYRKQFEQEMLQYEEDVETFYRQHPEAKAILMAKPSNKKKREKKVASQLVQSEPVSKQSRRSHQVISQEEEEDEQEEENEEEEEEDEDSEQDEGAPSRRVLEIDTTNLKDDDDSGGGDSGSDSDGS